MTNNIQIIDHATTLDIVRRADEVVANYLEATGNTTSAAGVLLGAIAIAADNLPDFTSVTITIDYTGYGIRYDSTLVSRETVIDGLHRGLDVMDDRDDL